MQAFDLTSFREGHLTPVFFGSALKNFGVGDLLDALATSRRRRGRSRPTSAWWRPTKPRMSAFVFKVQANMDPNHRDRIAFVRLCSGKLTRGMKVKQVRTGKVHEPATRRNSSSRRIARSPRRPMPATSSAFPITARCASATP